MSEQPCVQFVVLYTAQKLKKSKTWQDGFLKFYAFNKKMVLIDEKGYNIDRKFQKGKRPPQIGDEIEFDGHLVTVEYITKGSAQPESATEREPDPQIIHLENKRRQAQRSATLKLKAKWKPPTITSLSSCDIQSNAADCDQAPPEQTSIDVPMEEGTMVKIERIIVDKVPTHEDMYTSRLPKRTTVQSKKSVQQTKPSPLCIEPAKPAKTACQNLIPEIDILPKANDQLIPPKSESRSQSAITSDEKLLTSVQQLVVNKDGQKPTDKLARFRYPRAPKVDEQVQVDVDYQTNIAVVEEELSELQVEESFEKSNSNSEQTNLAESEDMETYMDEEDTTDAAEHQLPRVEITPSSTNENEDKEFSEHLDSGEDPQSNISTSATSFYNNVSANSEDKEMNAGQKRPVADNLANDVPSAKRRIKVGLSKAMRQPLTTRLSTATTTVDDAFSKSSFVKASEIRDIPAPIQVEAFHEAENPQRPNPPRVNPQKPDPQKCHKPVALIPMVNSTSKGFSIPSVINFPNATKVVQAVQSKKGTVRRLTVPTRFNSVSQYVDTFTKLLQEHLQVLLQTYSTYFHAQAKDWTQVPNPEQFARSRGLGLHMNASLNRSDRYISGDLDYCLLIHSPQHRSKYGKDDIWVVSKSLLFEANSTFLAKSTFYGPVGGTQIEIQCLTPRDGRIAAGMCKGSNSIVGLRTVSASNEFMMLAALLSNIEEAPLLPAILSYDNGSRPKRKQLHAIPKTTKDDGKIMVYQSDGIDVKSRLDETIKRFTLNEDQARVLVATAESIIECPQSPQTEPKSPILLVHGVFGSGKSYLAAVLIIFIQELIDDINSGREPEDRITFNILITSITNVAVDRILLSLLDLGYDDFVRVGSLRKIAKPILPHTIQSRVGKDTDIKELEAMLKDEAMSATDMASVETALQKFQKAESQAQISDARVIGTTCVASVFEIFNDLTIPLILLDEASQIMEPMAMVSITKFFADRLILIGDPLQLPPTLVTPCEPDIVGQGIEKTLFDRCVEMGIPPIMLRTQYRCHPKISRLSNNLFYERRLINGMRECDRPPLFTELPHVCFVNTNGTEMRRPGTQSYHNDVEVRVAAQAVQALVRLGVSPIDIGVISLYKEQADKIEAHLKGMSQSVFGSVQVSTVDAFQGAEKQVIILCTVRTNPSNFIDNPQRINVALSRAKSHLIILGKQDVLSMNQLWSCILKLTKGKILCLFSCI
ncbi:P-loop containing nucleoside triphosphate hydrolase protein [Umbelopsis sp. PMI_123]|nr:P-loop containing nucleoside triphosphate hydrolase protein [Umbelopsis sp. PMI_123]